MTERLEIGRLMGRHKKIEKALLLEAARHVVVDRGAANLTLEAVASDAGISKASVLYDYKSKDALVHALVSSKLDAAAKKIEQAKEALGNGKDAAIHARIAVANEFRPSRDDRSVAIAVISAMAGNAALRETGQAFYRAAVDDVVATASRPRGAMLAFLALEGLYKVDFLGFLEWSQDEFDALLRDIRWLSGQHLPEADDDGPMADDMQPEPFSPQPS